jgi:hypothetical protein
MTLQVDLEQPSSDLRTRLWLVFLLGALLGRRSGLRARSRRVLLRLRRVSGRSFWLMCRARGYGTRWTRRSVAAGIRRDTTRTVQNRETVSSITLDCGVYRRSSAPQRRWRPLVRHSKRRKVLRRYWVVNGVGRQRAGVRRNSVWRVNRVWVIRNMATAICVVCHLRRDQY